SRGGGRSAQPHSIPIAAPRHTAPSNRTFSSVSQSRRVLGHAIAAHEGDALHYLITGGAGFIGSHLAEGLLARGDEVTVLDDLSTGAIRNIRHLKGQPGFSYVIASVENIPLLAELVEDRKSVV